jgi:hypothetical protein
MQQKGLFHQISLYVVSFAIIFFYVQPTLVEVGEIQDKIEKYEIERENVDKTDSDLSDFIKKYDDSSQTDMRRLYMYMPCTESCEEPVPSKFNEVSVMRDIYLISQLSGVHYQQVSYEENSSNRASQPNLEGNQLEGIDQHEFKLSFMSSYQKLKDFLKYIQLNNYPLEVIEMDISNSGESDGKTGVNSGVTSVVAEDGSPMLNVNLVLRSYSMTDVISN